MFARDGLHMPAKAWIDDSSTIPSFLWTSATYYRLWYNPATTSSAIFVFKKLPRAWPRCHWKVLLVILCLYICILYEMINYRKAASMRQRHVVPCLQNGWWSQTKWSFTSSAAPKTEHSHRDNTTYEFHKLENSMKDLALRNEVCHIMDFKHLQSFYLRSITTRYVPLQVLASISMIYSALEMPTSGAERPITMQKAPSQWQVKGYSMNSRTPGCNCPMGGRTYPIARR